MRNVAALREALFDELAAPKGEPTEGDLARIGAKVAIADRIIDTMRVEVQLAAVLKGAADVPFIESQDPDHPSNKAQRPTLQAVDPMTRTAQLLTTGPSPSHPWRESVSRREGR